MNRTAYLTTDLAIRTLAKLIKARTVFHNLGNIPDGPSIFVINHFTRLETLLLPYYLYHLTKTTIWSLADDGLFKGGLKAYFNRVGVVSTRDPQRDKLIIKTLLAGQAHWVIFPEGRMVKNKKLIHRGKFLVGDDDKVRSPHTGAASLALRAEVFRRYLNDETSDPGSRRSLRKALDLDQDEDVSGMSVKVVPVNVTYYPIRAHDNLLSDIALKYVREPSERMLEELMTEGSMMLDGVDIDINFGRPLDTSDRMGHQVIRKVLSGPINESFDQDQRVRRYLQKTAAEMMQVYMTRIYSGTTVNLDHIIASLLRRRSFSPFTVDSLARSVYIAVDSIRAKRNYEKNLHAELFESQLHLLVDDRKGVIDNFLDLAVETTCLIPVRKKYRKNPFSWKEVALFHRARVDNPVRVMANEVEPMPDLQKVFRRVSLMPDLLVRWVVAKHLYRQGEDEYRAELAGAGKNVEFEFRTGRPFLIPSFSRKNGVVLVHSYLSVPEEMRQCGVVLRKHGCWVYGLRLPGHGTSPENLATGKWEDWRCAVERAYAMMNAICRNVVIVGFSAGGVLALELASRVESLSGVVAICPPYELKDYSKRFMPPTDIWDKLLSRWKRGTSGNEFVEFEPEIADINYYRNPISGVNEVDRLLAQSREGLEKLSHHILVITADRDPVVNSRGGRRIFERIGSRHKELVTISSDRHNIVNGPDSARTAAIIASFVNEFR